MSIDQTTKVDTWIKKIKNHWFLSKLYLFGIIVIAIGSFCFAMDKIFDFSILSFFGIFGTQQNLTTQSQLIENNNDANTTHKLLRFDINDPKLKLVRMIDLRAEVGASVKVGLCPDEPCVLIAIEKVDLMKKKPTITLDMQFLDKGIHSYGRNAMVFSIELIKGCGFTIRGAHWDVYFEIVDENVSSLRGWLAFAEGSQESGLLLEECGCWDTWPPDSSKTH